MSDSPYPGINAHLNSFLLQPDGGWEMFHAEHIVAIRQLLDQHLPDNYYAATEKSLQVGLVGQPPRRTTPDVGVYQSRPGDMTPVGSATQPTAVLPIDDAAPDDDPEPNAVTIYRITDGTIPGTLVTRVELLSPANKAGGSHHRRYLQRRRETLHAQINLVEIDYLHHTPPIVRQIPSYLRRDADATPYYVLVSHPQPSVAEGQMRLYAVAVDAPLPRLSVPLAGEDRVLLDLQAAYRRTVDNARVLRLLADPTRPLVHPDRYTEADQERIAELAQAFKD